MTRKSTKKTAAGSCPPIDIRDRTMALSGGARITTTSGTFGMILSVRSGGRNVWTAVMLSPRETLALARMLIESADDMLPGKRADAP